MKRFARHAAVVTSLTAASCTVSLRDPAGRACDDTHGCAEGRICRAGACVAPIAEDASIGDAAPSTSTDATQGRDGGDVIDISGGGTFSFDFENGCGAWIGYESTEASYSTSHAGKSSCGVCGHGAEFALDDKGSLRRPLLGKYRVEAWLRLADGSVSPPYYGVMVRSINDSAGFEEVEKKAVDGVVSTEWGLTVVELTLTKEAEALNVIVFSTGNACVLVDDVKVERVP